MYPVARLNPTISINSNCGNVTDSYKNVWNNCNISISDEKRQVLEWLSPLASRERHQTVREARMEGVGDWLLCNRIFSKWRVSRDPAAKPVLLCYGDPGVGKTFISSLVIDTLSKGIGGDGVAVTYVYCDFSARNAQSASTILGSMLRQVVGALAEIPDEVQKAFEQAKRQVDGCGLLLPEILGMLTKYLPSLKRVFICIDALDELATKHRAQLWKSLQHVVQECPNTRLFLTGRPQIRTEVENCFPQHVDMVPINPTSTDIRIYIEKRLEEDLDTSAMDNELRADILRVIPERISGIFLLVCINMDAILVAPTIHQKRQALHGMTKGSGLQDAYDTTLGRIRDQGGSRSKLGMEVLMWVSHCERPLKPAELGHALGVELGVEDYNAHNVPSIRTILDCTLGLAIADEKALTVRLLHHTLQEYLGEHPTLFVTAHAMMAEICLTYLHCQLVRTLQENLEKALEIAPFLEYATCFWGTHAANEVTEPVTSLALQLLDGYENHVSADILWPKRIGRWAWEGTVKGISGLHCIAFWGIAEIAISMLEAKRWDVNGRDSRGDTPLMWAVKYGNNTIVKLFLDQEDIKPDAILKDGRTVFSFAVLSGNECAVKLLLAHRGVNPNAPDTDGRTPLSLAVARGHKGVAKLILEHVDIGPNPSEGYVLTPLFYAASSGREDMVKLLLELSGVNPNSSDDNGQSLLSYAASGGHEGVVRLLLERGDVNPDSPDSYGRTPLSYAVWEGHAGSVELFLKCGDFNPNFSDGYGRTHLSYAASRGHEGVVKLFLECGGVNPNLSDNKGRPPLSYAASEGHEGVVKLLVENPNIDLSISDSNGLTPLSYAAKWGLEDLVELFLKCDGVNPDPLDTKGRTPLSYASSGGHEGVVKLFLEHEGVNPNSWDNRGRPPLFYAGEGGHEGVVKLLVESPNIDPCTLDSNGLTPLSYAAKWGREDLVELFLKCRGVNPNFPDNQGRTPLSHASSEGHESVVKLFLERGDVNLNLPDSKGRTPLLFAVISGHDGVVKLLLERKDIDLYSQDSWGQTPISLAAQLGHVGVQEVFWGSTRANF